MCRGSGRISVRSRRLCFHTDIGTMAAHCCGLSSSFGTAMAVKKSPALLPRTLLHPEVVRTRAMRESEWNMRLMEDVPSIEALTNHGARVVSAPEPQLLFQ